MSQIAQYVERHEEAYKSFIKMYTLEHPMPSKPSWWTGLPWLMIPFTGIALAAIGLSALRTAPVFQQIAEPLVGVTLSYVEAFLAIIVIEVFVVIGRYVIMLFSAQTKSVNANEVKKWMKAGFWASFIVAVLANLYGSVSHLEIIGTAKPILDLLIGVIVGLSAPFLAFITGDILAVLWITSDKNRRETRENFGQAMDEYVDARDRSWNSQKTRAFGLKLEMENIPTLSNGISIGNPVENILPAASTLGHTKAPDAAEKVKAYLVENPDAINIKPLELASMLGVGKSTVYNVIKEMKQ